MLTKVDVITAQGDVLELPMDDDPDGYTVLDIEGTDPVKAVIVTSSFANVDGEQFESSRREARDVVLKLGLEPGGENGTGRQLRNNLYKYLMPQMSVTLRFYDDEMEAEFVDIQGVVETFDCPLYVQEIEATINIRCLQSDFYEIDSTIVEGLTTNDVVETIIDYNGTIETGILFNITMDRAVPEFMIYHRSANNTLSALEFEQALSAGDTLDISTVSGAKGLTLTNDVNGSNSILYGMNPTSNWIQLFPGRNYIRVFIDDLGEPIPYTIEYTTKYGGL
jgi:Phage tail protein